MPNIILNGSPIVVPNESIDYGTIVFLANTTGHPTVTVKHPNPKSEFHGGCTLHRQSARIKLVDGLVINCIHTGAA